MPHHNWAIFKQTKFSSKHICQSNYLFPYWSLIHILLSSDSARACALAFSGFEPRRDWASVQISSLFPFHHPFCVLSGTLISSNLAKTAFQATRAQKITQQYARYRRGMDRIGLRPTVWKIENLQNSTDTEHVCCWLCSSWAWKTQPFELNFVLLFPSLVQLPRRRVIYQYKHTISARSKCTMFELIYPTLLHFTFLNQPLSIFGWTPVNVYRHQIQKVLLRVKESKECK